MIPTIFVRNGRTVVANALVLALVAPTVLLPQLAFAQTPVTDVGHIGVTTVGVIENTINAGANVESAVAGGSTALATGLSAEHDVEASIKDWILTPLAIALGQAAIKSITDSTVNWINGGFDGSPAFATDLKKNMRQLADGVARDFLTDLANNTKINSPFIDSLVTNVGAAYYLYSGRDALAAQLQDTLGQSSRDAAAFRAGNFNEGGWGAFVSQVTNDANNPIGARMIASQALASRISAAANQRAQELAWGSGFLSWKGDCIRTNANTTPANVNNGISVSSGTGDTTSNGVTVTNGGNTGATATNGVTLSDAEGCLEQATVTPGSFIEEKLNITSNSPLRQLELADSIDRVVGALAQQLISKALGGSGGLRGVSNPTPGGGASTVSQSGTSSGTGLVAPQEGLKTTIQTSMSQVTAWKNDSQTVLTVAESAKAVCANNPDQLAKPIEPAIKTATEAITKATDLLSSLQDLLDELERSPTGPNSPTNSSYLQTVAAYQALPIPSAITMELAAKAAKDSGTAATPSLYTALKTLSTSQCVPYSIKVVPAVVPTARSGR